VKNRPAFGLGCLVSIAAVNLAGWANALD